MKTAILLSAMFIALAAAGPALNPLSQNDDSVRDGKDNLMIMKRDGGSSKDGGSPKRGAKSDTDSKGSF